MISEQRIAVIGTLALAVIVMAIIGSPSDKAPQKAAAQPPSFKRQAFAINQPAEIDRYLASFKTKKNLPLRAALEPLGLHLIRVDVMPVENFAAGIGNAADQPGDWYVTLVMEGTPKRLPCGLDSRYKGASVGIAGVSSMIARGNGFLPDPGDEDPLLHWVATGKCLAE